MYLQVAYTRKLAVNKAANVVVVSIHCFAPIPPAQNTSSVATVFEKI